MKRNVSRFRVSGFEEFVLFCLVSCLVVCGLSSGAEAFEKTTGERGEMLIGAITPRELFKECPTFKEFAEAYVPNQEIIAKIKGLEEKISIIMFLGTWCGDSQRESPILLKMLETANNPKISLEMYGVDTNKDDGKGLAKKYGIERVPTVIFLKGGKELGRIVENPQETMEADFLAIVGAK